MKQIFYFLLLIGFTGLAAQDLFFTDAEPVVISNSFDVPTEDTHIYLTNTSTETMNLIWEKVHNEFDENWSTTICFGELCYPSWTYSLGFSIQPGEELDIKVTFSAYEFCGSGTMDFVVTNPDDADMTLTKSIVFSIEGCQTVAVNEISQNDISIYPNPVISDMTIVLDQNTNIVDFAEIYNLTGRKVRDLYIDTQSFDVDLSDLNAGIFFIKFYDNKGNVVSSKRFSKAR